MTLEQRIQELRKQAGLSQEGLGEALGVSRQAVSKWEGDNGIPELDTLIAMSRLFGVTIGQLLGVEEPVQTPEETPAPLDEDRVEAILHRYVEESRQHEPPKKRSVWLWPLAACCVLLAAVIVLFVQTKQVEQNIDHLWDNVIDINGTILNVRNQVGGLSDELRDFLEAEGTLLSTFEYQVVGFDVAAQTVDIELSATLKTYTAGETAQFCLNWIKTDATTGQAVTDPVEGPEFKTRITIPMNLDMSISTRFTAVDGKIREQKAATLFDTMHPKNFMVKMRTAGSLIDPSKGLYRYNVEVSSDWPEQIYPVEVVIVVTLNGKEVCRREELVDGTDGVAALEGRFQMDPFSDEDEVKGQCYVTDNYGRVIEFDLS